MFWSPSYKNVWVLMLLKSLFVEVKPGLIEQLGTNVRSMNNGVTLIEPREKAWPKAFY